MQLLQHAAALSPGQRAQQRAPRPDDLIAQLQGAALNLGRGPTDQRQQLRQEVFRPHVALPTISVEQQVRLRRVIISCWTSWPSLSEDCVMALRANFSTCKVTWRGWHANKFVPVSLEHV